ncbi:efflux transporter outer membrane subunit [Pseudomonas sp. KNUC1026]|uniref:efflux transporter outer membrane subunit n=1 Tax=Pseudomonas sp. KNUC1026 TaxID=2893890 RepID=UPI001F3EA891|nr:TolC family protein [Pseudomonas sp. KNUC1026]UFH48220.1 TolC family protein [Pseudomonas sp. KNUC1026]
MARLSFKHTFTSLSLAALCACQGQAPQPPAAPATPSDLALARLPAGVGEQPLPDRWWALYQDPALDHWVRQALASNQDLAQADARLAAVMAGIRQAEAAQGPQTELGLAAQYGRTADDQTLAQAQATSTRAPSQWQWNPAASLSWQLDLFGQVRAAIEAAKAHAEAAAAARDQLRLVVAAQTSLAWLDLCTYGEQIEQTQASLNSLDDSLRLTERQREAGVATELDSARLQALARRTRAQLPWLQARQKLAIAQLALLAGQAEQPVQAQACKHIPRVARALPAGDAWQLFKRRPDVRQAEREALASAWTLQNVRADLYPKVVFGASLSASSSAWQGLGDRQSVTFGVGPLISWQFPDRRANQARVQAADAQRMASAANWRRSVQGALTDVRQAFARYDGERQRGLWLAQALEQNERAFALADSSYHAGALDGLQRLDAQRELIAARLRQITARQRQAHSEIALFQALGGGWQAPVDDLRTGNRP